MERPRLRRTLFPLCGDPSLNDKKFLLSGNLARRSVRPRRRSTAQGCERTQAHGCLRRRHVLLLAIRVDEAARAIREEDLFRPANEMGLRLSAGEKIELRCAVAAGI